MKMIFAMLHSEDVDETVEELNKEKYWVTKLSTTGGFLKNKNVTLVIGTEDEQVPGALKILKECAGARQSVKYTMPSMSTRKSWPWRKLDDPDRYAGRRMYRLCSGCGSVREILRLGAGRCGCSECPMLSAESCEPNLYAIRMR